MNFTQKSLMGLSAITLLSGSCAVWAASAVHGRQFQDWGGNCRTTPQNGQECYLEQVLSQGNQKVMVSVIGFLPGKSLPTMAFEFPAKTVAPAGFLFNIDGRPTTRFKGNCTPTRCVGSFALNSNIQAQIQRGRAASVSYAPDPHQPLTELPLSLMGITEGLGALL